MDQNAPRRLVVKTDQSRKTPLSPEAFGHVIKTRPRDSKPVPRGTKRDHVIPEANHMTRLTKTIHDTKIIQIDTCKKTKYMI